MIVCSDCGASNTAGDDFCGSCGAFLEFAAAPAVVPAVSTASLGGTAVIDSPPATAAPGVSRDDRRAVEEREQAERNAALEAQQAAAARAAAAESQRLQEESQARARAAERDAAEAAARLAEEKAAEEAAQQAALETAAREAAEQARRAEEAANQRARAAAEATRLAEEESRHQAELAAERAAEETRRLAAEQAARDAAEAVARAAAEQADAQAQEAAQAAAREAERLAQESAAREQAIRDEQERSRREAQAAAKEAQARSRAEDERIAAEVEAARVQRQAAEETAATEAAAATERRIAAQAEASRLAAARAEGLRAAEEAAAKARAEADAAAEREAAAAKATQELARMSALVAKPPAARPLLPPEPSSAAPTAETAGGSPAQKPTTARKPSEVRERPAAVASTPAPVNIINPGDLVCGQCGTGNAPERRFCRRCGTSLVAAAVAPRPPWWRRLITRRRSVVAAGDRPGMTRASAPGGAVELPPGVKAKRARRKLPKPTLKKILPVVALLGVAAVLLIPSLRSQVTSEYHTVKNKVTPSYAEVQPDAETSSSHTLGHPPKLAFDGDKGTYWEEGKVPPSGRGQLISAHFNAPVRIRKIGFDLGISDMQKTFITAARPRRLHLVFSSGKTTDLTLADTGGFQSFSVDGGQSTDVSFEVREVSAAGVTNPKVSIREIELFTLSP